MRPGKRRALTKSLAANRGKPIWRQTMDPKKTALVLIEFQNDFTTPGGTLHDAVKGVMDKNNMLNNTILHDRDD